jgi:hypothetical protein
MMTPVPERRIQRMMKETQQLTRGSEKVPRETIKLVAVCRHLPSIANTSSQPAKTIVFIWLLVSNVVAR